MKNKMRMIGKRMYIRVPSTKSCDGCDMKNNEECLLSRINNPTFCMESGRCYVYKEAPKNAHV